MKVTGLTLPKLEYTVIPLHEILFSPSQPYLKDEKINRNIRLNWWYKRSNYCILTVELSKQILLSILCK